MKLIGYTCTFNEAATIPYVMPYVEMMGYDKFIVYDNESTDNTVKLLSKYPFVEIRNWDTGGVFSEIGKRNLQIDAYEKCSSIAIETGEDVWMTFTDFDEVIYCTRERGGTVKDYLSWLTVKGYNCFDGRMIQLTCDGSEENNSLLPHEWNGVRGTWWLTEGKKPLLFKVNDFKYAEFICGNHAMGVIPNDGVNIINLADTREFHGFHFKYFKPDILEKKEKTYKFYGAGQLTMNGEYLDAIKKIRSTSFPLDMYFLMNGFFSSSNSFIRDGFGEGIYLKQ
jgi:hypothetical protein